MTTDGRRPELLGRVAFARRLGVSPRHLDNLAAEGLPRRKNGRGAYQYEWEAGRDWYIARKETAAARRAEPASLEDAKQRRTTADARLMELDLAAREGRMVTVADVQRHLDDLLQRLRAKIVTMPTRLAHRLAGATQAEAQTRLDEAAQEMLEELCRTGEEAEGDDEPVGVAVAAV